MPLNTEIIRDGEQLQLAWSDFHVAAMAIAASLDDPKTNGPGIFKRRMTKPEFKMPPADKIPEEFIEWADATGDRYPEVPCPITAGEAFHISTYPMLGATPLNSGDYTLKREHKFLDCSDGEILHLLPGDVLRAVRTMK